MECVPSSRGRIGVRREDRFWLRVSAELVINALRIMMDKRLAVSVANIIDVKFADSDQLIRGFGDNHHQLA